MKIKVCMSSCFELLTCVFSLEYASCYFHTTLCIRAALSVCSICGALCWILGAAVQIFAATASLTELFNVPIRIKGRLDPGWHDFCRLAKEVQEKLKLWSYDVSRWIKLCVMGVQGTEHQETVSSCCALRLLPQLLNFSTLIFWCLAVHPCGGWTSVEGSGKNKDNIYVCLYCGRKLKERLNQINSYCDPSLLNQTWLSAGGKVGLSSGDCERLYRIINGKANGKLDWRMSATRIVQGKQLVNH